MTPPCPNCGTVYHLTSRATIDTFILDTPAAQDGFMGVEYRCNKCRHRWRVAAHFGPLHDLEPQPQARCS